jgi:TonB family protein
MRKLLIFSFVCTLLTTCVVAQTTSNPRAIPISSSVLTGIIKHQELPLYPPAALQGGIKGDVVLSITIDANGYVVETKAVQGDDLLVEACKDALTRFQFRPYILNGTPIRILSQVSFRFSIKGKGDTAKGKVEATFP